MKEKFDKIPDYNGIGIYQIYNPIKDKSYIGSSINVKERIKNHINRFETGKCNYKFKEDLKDYELFIFTVLEKLPYGVNRYDIYERERYYIEHYDVIAKGYNIREEASRTKELDLSILERFKKENNIKMVNSMLELIEKNETPIIGRKKLI